MLHHALLWLLHHALLWLAPACLGGGRNKRGVHLVLLYFRAATTNEENKTFKFERHVSATPVPSSDDGTGVVPKCSVTK